MSDGPSDGGSDHGNSRLILPNEVELSPSLRAFFSVHTHISMFPVISRFTRHTRAVSSASDGAVVGVYSRMEDPSFKSYRPPDRVQVTALGGLVHECF